MAVVTLSCPTCSAPLAVTPSAEMLRCAFCHNTHRVAHDNGHISLAPLVERMGAMQSGVDRVAAELAIPRLEREIEALEDEMARVGRTDPDVVVPRTRIEANAVGAILLLCFAALVGLIIWFPLAIAAFLVMLAFLVYMSNVSNRRIAEADRRIRERLAQISEHISDRRSRIATYRQLLNS